MVKINIDENQALAQQLRIQSIPMVYAFKNGQPADGFQGALPESQIKGPHRTAYRADRSASTRSASNRPRRR